MLHINRLNVQCDSHMLVRAPQEEKKLGNYQIWALMKTCTRWLKNSPMYQIKYICREANMTVDYFARITAQRQELGIITNLDAKGA